VHGTALLRYRGTEGDPSPFDGPTNYAEYVNIQGTEKAKALLKGSETSVGCHKTFGRQTFAKLLQNFFVFREISYKR
jgi:hypothetical protein